MSAKSAETWPCEAITAHRSIHDGFVTWSDFANETSIDFGSEYPSRSPFANTPDTLTFEAAQYCAVLNEFRLRLAVIFGENSLEERIRDILFFVWDPVMVSVNTKLKNEYDDFIPRFAALVRSGANEETIRQWLQSIETGYIGALAKPDDRLRAAALLAGLSQELGAA
jgi:hypothetical protein